MLGVYRRFAEEWMALPVIPGIKTESEKFAGAVQTLCIEAMMGDRRALQAGTSHFLGQNFARAFDVTFQDEAGGRQHVWATSWGVSTRLIGALIMGHGDEKGLRLPPRLAPYQVVVVPIYKTDEEKTAVLESAHRLVDSLKASARVKLDDRDTVRPGFKFNEWELRGVPLRVEMGPKDLAKGQVVLARRDTGAKEFLPQEGLAEHIRTKLDDIHRSLFEHAKAFRDANTFRVDTWEEFRERTAGEGGSGFLLAHWDGTAETEALIKEETKATIRCIPLDNPQEQGACVRTGRPSKERVIFAKAY